MSEVIIPDAAEVSDVAENVDAVEIEETTVNYSEKTLAELVSLFEKIALSEERMKMYKEAEAIKAAFYKKLSKERADAAEAVSEDALEDSEDAFTKIENAFKAFYNAYKKERAEYNARLDREREENLAMKEAVIADLKALLEKDEDVNATFPEFREIQNRWRTIGPVPAQNYRDINDTYQINVEKFYDKVKINRELREIGRAHV